jgi:hypothetical protein
MGDGQKCIAQSKLQFKLIDLMNHKNKFNFSDSCSKDNSICDLNAICIFEPKVGDHICRCKSGYEGDGLNRR